MDNKNDKNLGDQIRSTVQEAVDTMNFDQLNKNISDSVKMALGEIKDQLNGTNNLNRTNKTWHVNYQDKNQSSTYTTSFSEPQNWEQRRQAAMERAKQLRNNGSHRFNEGKNTKQNQTYSRNKAKTSYEKQMRYSNNQSSQVPMKQSELFLRRANNLPGSISGILLQVFGYLGSFGLGIAMIVLMLVARGMSYYGVLDRIAGAMLPFFLVSLIMVFQGNGKRKRVKRFRQYLKYFGNQSYCKISDLASNVGRSKRYVLKDIRKMLRMGVVPEAHLDEQGTYIILNKETYQQYLQTNAEYERKKQEEKQKNVEEETSTETNQSENAELLKVIQEGKDYIDQIQDANDALPGEEISRKLSRLEHVTSKIFICVKQHPEQLPELRKFMEYYLPITLKLVNAYKELEAQTVQGDNIKTSKQEIMNTLDTINSAFETLLDSLFEATAMEVSSDISVLETLFAQDGLTKKDFDIK